MCCSQCALQQVTPPVGPYPRCTLLLLRRAGPFAIVPGAPVRGRDGGAEAPGEGAGAQAAATGTAAEAAGAGARPAGLSVPQIPPQGFQGVALRSRSDVAEWLSKNVEAASRF